ncbi:MAG: hypothetical protein K2Q06_15020 [Parvularculaceae bacterium]|nr:hypothetical protein [Parvularculaceae bacterium]
MRRTIEHCFIALALASPAIAGGAAAEEPPGLLAQADDLLVDAAPMTEEELSQSRGGLDVDGVSYDFGAALHAPASALAVESRTSETSSTLIPVIRTTVTQSIRAESGAETAQSPGASPITTVTIGGQTIFLPAQAALDASALGDASVVIDNTVDNVRIVRTVNIDVFVNEAALAATSGAVVARSVVDLDFLRALTN